MGYEDTPLYKFGEWLSGFGAIQQKDEMHCWACVLVWFGRVMCRGTGDKTQEAMFTRYRDLGYTVKEGDFVDAKTGASLYVGAVTGYRLIQILERQPWRLKVMSMTGSDLSDARMEVAMKKGPAILGFNMVDRDGVTGNHVNAIMPRDLSAYNPSYWAMEPLTGSYEKRYLSHFKANPFLILGYIE